MKRRKCGRLVQKEDWERWLEGTGAERPASRYSEGFVKRKGKEAKQGEKARGVKEKLTIRFFGRLTTIPPLRRGNRERRESRRNWRERGTSGVRSTLKNGFDRRGSGRRQDQLRYKRKALDEAKNPWGVEEHQGTSRKDPMVHAVLNLGQKVRVPRGGKDFGKTGVRFRKKSIGNRGRRAGLLLLKGHRTGSPRTCEESEERGAEAVETSGRVERRGRSAATQRRGLQDRHQGGQGWSKRHLGGEDILPPG